MIASHKLRKRDIYLNKLIAFQDTEPIKVVTGIRRCGKSSLLKLMAAHLRENGVNDEQIIEINFESYEFIKMTSDDLYQYVKERSLPGKRMYLFFDELQRMAGWENTINAFRVDLDCDIYITGSNAYLLSSEYSTYLSGRCMEIKMLPLSFREFLDFHGFEVRETQSELGGLRKQVFDKNGERYELREVFAAYMRFGGMPDLSRLIYQEEPVRQYLNDLYDSVQLKDIVKRNRVRDVDLLERILAYVMANVGTTFSAGSLAKFFKSEQRSVSPETVLNYIRYCCDAYLFYRVKRQDLQGKQILATSEKYYIADHGIREAVFGGNMRDINLVLENIVFLELLRRGYTVTVGKAGEKEVDFVCGKRGETLYVQVTYLLASEETVAREFGAYDGIRDNFPKYVVSMDELDLSRNGIKHRNIRDFLLAERWD